MPRDVMLGEGYENGVMIHPQAPGQHRGQFEYQDGSSVLAQGQNGVGDLGRHRRHRHGGGRGWGGGWGWGYGPGWVPYEPLTIEVVTKDTEEEEDKKELGGLGNVTHCIERIIAVAAKAAREAVEGARSGIFKTSQDVREHIRRRVCEEVREHARTYCKAVNEAVRTAFESALPHVEKAISARGGQGVSGLGQSAVTVLTGSGQDYYNVLTAAQNRSLAIQAEIAGIGKDAWNAAMTKHRTSFEAQGWSPVENYLYDNMMSFWLAQSKRLILTPSKQPPTADIQDVIRLAGGTEKMIGLVKSAVPQEVVAQAEADRREIEAKLAEMGPLQSPSDTARQTVVDDLLSKLRGLFSFSAIPIAAIAAGLVGAYLLFTKR